VIIRILPVFVDSASGTTYRPQNDLTHISILHLMFVTNHPRPSVLCQFDLQYSTSSDSTHLTFMALFSSVQ